MWNDLKDIHDSSWSLLKRGVVDAKSPLHQGIICTTGKSGPNARTVILRKVLSDPPVIICYSDIRAQKIEDLHHDLRVGWVFWHDKQRIQLRCKGTATLHTEDEVAMDHWLHLSSGSRKNYSAVLPPGTVIQQADEGINTYSRKENMSEEDQEKWRKNFVVIKTHISHMDWLWLRREGHQRAYWEWNQARLVTSHWIVP